MRTRTSPQSMATLAGAGKVAALFALVSVLFGCAWGGTGGAWLSYTRSGGLTGATASLSVTEKGKVTVKHSDGKTSTVDLSAADLAKLRAAVSAAELESLEAKYDNPAARDAYEYKLVAGDKTVQWVDGVTPKSLIPLQDLLDKWMNG